MKADNETDLLNGLARNDRKAIETIYKENYNVVQALILKNSGNIDDAKDIFQDAMMVLYERVQSDAFQLNCQIKTYLYSVSRRLWLKKLVHQNRFLIIDEPEPDVINVDGDVDAQEKHHMDFLMMERAMGNLGEPCKSLLEAFYMEKRTMQEIASNFGYTNAENAKNQKYKCLMRLKKLFFSQYKSHE